MTLEEKVKNDLKQAMLNKDEVKKSTLRMVLGEIPRLNKKINERPTDTEIESIIKKLIKSEMIVLKASAGDDSKSEYIRILNSYLPKMMSEKEIKKWILDNIDLNDYNPKIKAMSTIMKALNGKADGNVVRKILI